MCSEAARKFLLLIFLLVSGPAWSQIVVTGTVREKETNQPLQFVNVFLASSTTGTTTAEDGSFKFTVPQKGKYELTASFIGYQSFKKIVSFDKDSTYRFIIQLPQNTTELASIVVVADSNFAQKKPERV
ncbi:MAG: carboxypeptidase-like regulatory domain-containing protein [Tepidisphaeraceae bacterium]